MFTFKKEHSQFAYSKQVPQEVITVSTSHDGLYEVLEAFERFLQGCGYSFEGHLEIVNDFDKSVPEPMDSIYEDGYESPSNGAAEWPFPISKTP